MSESMVTIATFGTPVEAQLARNLLEEAGIESVLADAETVGMLWHVGSALGGVKLQVAEADEARARAVLARRARFPEPPARDDYGLDEGPRKAVVRARPYDPTEDEEDVPETPADATARRALRSAVIGLLLCPPLLHFYSVGLLLQLSGDREGLSAAGKRSAYAAAALDAMAFVAAALLWRGLFWAAL
jgi:hypothetical protein